MMIPKQKFGFVALVGRSNVGKSTLLNALVGTKVSITSPKPQTTRLPVQGVLTSPEGQIVFVDTPGVFQKTSDPLSQKLLAGLRDALVGVDAIVYVVDPTREIGSEERATLAILGQTTAPKILALNKSDVRSRPFVGFYNDLEGVFVDKLEVSAMTGANMNLLLETLWRVLPEGEPHFPSGQTTSLPGKIWVAELIREKLFLRLRQEVPYSVHVEVEEMDERPDGTQYIRATILTTDARYQRMIIGRGGQGVKEIGQSTRRELEAVWHKKIFLELEVMVDPHWVERLI